MPFKGRSVLALIPARGGSKGVKRKNLRMVRGKPLLAYTINAALESSFIDNIYVSSDDLEILEVAEKMGVEGLPRAPAACTDAAVANDVIADFSKKIQPGIISGNPYIVFLQPTSPLRTGRHIDEAFALMDDADCEVCVSVVEATKTPFKAFILTSCGRLESLFDESLTNANRQSLSAAYYPNGAIYIFPYARYVENKGIPSNRGIPYIMSDSESLDIDTEEDLIKLENLHWVNL